MKLKSILSEEDDNRAVSPVIGVILMVAITVILAAVIGTFVLGLGDDIEQDVQAGATVNQDGQNTQVTVTWTSQGTADGIAVLGVANETKYNIDSVGNKTSFTAGDPAEDLSEGDQISVVAYSGGSADGDTAPGSLQDDAERVTVIRTVDLEFAISSS